MSNEIQRLEDFELIQGEYLSLTLSCKRKNGVAIDISSFTPTLKIYRYGDRREAILTIHGQKVDTDKISFKLSSTETDNLISGKFEYIVTVAYSNGDNNVGLGYITIM